MKHVMLDLETLGTTADSVILSIGAVRFDANDIDDNGFYAAVSVDSNLALGRTVSEDTLAWWMKQSDAARRVFSEPNVPLDEALNNLVGWFEHGPSDPTVWSNGAAFDIPMLEHAFKQAGLTVPWKFWNALCFRTMKSLPIAKKATAVKAVGKHNALSDATAQAVHLQSIWSTNAKALAI